VPAAAVGDSDPIPDPLIIGGHLVQLTATHGHAVTLTRDGSGWSVSSGPVGAPTTAALVGGHLYVTLTHGSRNPATLWQADARAWHSHLGTAIRHLVRADAPSACIWSTRHLHERGSVRPWVRPR